MSIFNKFKPETERELHSIIEKEIELLEEGLVILKHEFALEKGTPDFVCVDSGGQLVIIEVKLNEDSNMLFQALRYYNEIDKKRYSFKEIFSDKTIDSTQHPRIILIAETVSDELKQLSTLVVPDVDIYEYTTLSSQDGLQGICYHPALLPKIEEPLPKPVTIEDLSEYITNESLKPLFDSIIKDVKKISEGIEEYATTGYVGFKYKNRLIGWLTPNRKSFDFGVNVIDEDTKSILDQPSIRIKTGAENWDEIMEKIETTVKTLQKT